MIMSMENYLFLDSDKTERISTPLPTHLDAPLRDHDLNLILRRKELDRRVRGFIRQKLKDSQFCLNLILTDGWLSDLSLDKIIIGFAEVQKIVTSHMITHPMSALVANHITQYKRICIKNLSMQSSSLGLDCPDIQYTEEEEQLLNHWYNARAILQEGVLLSGCPVMLTPQLPDKWQTIHQGTWKWVISQDLVLYINKYISVIIYNGKVFLGTRDHYLGLHDIIVQRSNIIHSSILAPQFQDPTYPSLELVMRTFNWGDTILEMFGNPGYELIGQWEPLCVGSLSAAVPDPYWDNTLFLTTMRREFCSSSEKHLKLLEGFWEEGVTIIKEAATINTNQATQLYGLYRIWGHPTIDSKAGIAKLKSSACKNKAIDYSKVDSVTIKFKEKFCLAYRAKHHVWPRLNVEDLPSTSYLRDCIQSNSDIFLRDRRYVRQEWLQVKGLKTFEVLPKYNLVKLLSDKAMSLNIKEIESFLNKGSIGPAWFRSVLYNWLVNDIGDPKEFLEYISKNGFGEFENIIGVCPKEREIKLFARMFALLTLYKRMYVVLTEAMLAEHVLPYFPEITMIDDYITLMKKMYTVTSGKNSKGSIPIYTSIDFVKWNTHMRKEETWDIFEFLDQLFGISNIYTRTHEMFTNSQLYLADGTYIPTKNSQNQFIEDDYCWSGHLGGMEGLRQKGWTLFTVCEIDDVMSEYDYDFYLMGQGDNQIFKILYPSWMTAQEIRDEHLQIMKKMDKYLSLVGPPIKLSESWSSSNLFVYGKFPILRGVPLSMSLKRICRMFSMDNEGFPTLDSSISSLTANVQSACNYSHDVRFLYYLYSIELLISLRTFYEYNYLGQYPLKLTNQKSLIYGVPKDKKRIIRSFAGTPIDFRSITSLSDEFLSRFLLFPKILGGYSICLLGSLFSNGFPDPVSENISLLKRIWHIGYQQAAIEIILSPVLKDWVEADMLCEDPVSLNLMHPSSPKESVRRLVQEFLRGSEWITNTYFKTFLQVSLKRQKPLCELLMQMKPCNPRVMHSIVESTLVGRALQVVGQLDKTNTLTSMMINQSGADVNKIVSRSEQQYFFSVLCNLYEVGNHTWCPGLCSREYSDLLRCKGWGVDISGVTVAPIFEAFKAFSGSDVNCEGHDNIDKGYFLLAIDQGMSLADYRSRTTIGNFTPFLGSRTAVKTKSYGKDLARQTQPVLKNAAELLNFINWGTKPDSNLSSLIKGIFSTLTDMSPESFIPLTGQVSGSIEHRWDDTSTKHGGNLSIMYTLVTYFHLSTNSLVGYQAKGINYNLHFQALMSIAACWSSIKFLVDYPSTLHFHVTCPRCIVPINEDLMEIPPFDPSQVLIKLEGNPICWVSSIDIPLYSTVSGGLLPIDTLSEHSSKCKSAFYYLAAERCISLMRSKTFESGDGKMRPTLLNGLNISWNSKIDYPMFMNHILLHLVTYFCYKSDFANWKFWESREDMLYHIRTLIASIPCLNFTWASNFYLSERLTDEMVNQPWSAKFPLDIPPSHFAIGKHTQSQLLNLLTSWIYFNDIPTWEDNSISGPSKVADYHPIFKYLTKRLLVSSPDEFSKLKFTCLIFKRIISSYSLDLGNHLRMDWMLDHHLTLIREDRTIMPFVDKELVLNLIISSNPMIVNNHIDFLAKHLPVIELSTLSLVTPSNLLIQDLPSTQCLMLKSSCSDYCNNNVSFSIPCVDWTPVPLDIQLIKRRTITYPTSAHYKLVEILRNLELVVEGRVAAIADGGGGFALTLSKIEEVEEVFYNSLFHSDQLLDQAAPNFIPPAFVGESFCRNKLIHLDQVYSGATDISERPFWNSFHKIHNEKPFTFLCCDAEAGEAGTAYKGCKVVYNVVRYCAGLGIPHILFKTYLNPWSLIHIYNSICSSSYKEFTLIKGIWSSINNREVYIYCKGPLTTLQICKFSDTSTLIGPSCRVKLKRAIEEKLKHYWDFEHPVPELCHKLYNQILRPRMESSHDTQLINIFLGPWNDQDYIFPWSLIKNKKLGISPVRFGRVSRRRGNLNLITRPLVKVWVLGWLLGLFSKYQYDPDQLQSIYNNGTIFIYETAKSWSFWMSFDYFSPQLPSSRGIKIKTLLKYHEFKKLIQLSTMITVTIMYIDNSSKVVSTVPRTLLKSVLPMDPGINILQ
ncbi:MAG: RdRp and L protein [Apis rhabdovirus 4]|uniref:RNA-directed RNA polymerase L n=1 Tax=Apis rhabdovirus 4 TaxID=2873558 RepID=A0A8K1MZU7_9RHAB|nr:MAG: RdRp and L protein [Apis rhabdovirus 4]